MRSFGDTPERVAEGSIRLGILKVVEERERRRKLQAVAEGSIRLGILKVTGGQPISSQALCCRGLDPIGDTERPSVDTFGSKASSVAEGSIRLGILKAAIPATASRSLTSCRGLDPIGDTERGGSGGIRRHGMWLQRARSDWGY